MPRKTITSRPRNSIGMLALFVATLALMVPWVAIAQQATPDSPGSLQELGNNTRSLDGEQKVWQINKVTVPEGGDASEEFKVSFGFIFAYQIPIDVTINGDDPVQIKVGESLPIQDGDHITAKSLNGKLGSFYTIELIELSDSDSEIIDRPDINNELNQQVIGAPFNTMATDYTMTLSRGTLESGVAVPLRSTALPALVLVLEGELINARGEKPSATIGPGFASAGFGAGTMVAGPDGATFLLADLTEGTEGGTPVVN